MNISKFTAKLVLASLFVSVIQGPLALTAGDNPTNQPSTMGKMVQEGRAIVNRLLESAVAKETGKFFYKGVHGFVDGCINGTTKIIATIKPESTLGKAGVVSVTVIVVGGIATATYFFKDKSVVKTTLGTLKSFVTSPKALLKTGLVATAAAITGGYVYGTGDWKTSAYVTGGALALYGLKKLTGSALNKFQQYSAKKEQAQVEAILDEKKKAVSPSEVLIVVNYYAKQDNWDTLHAKRRKLCKEVYKGRLEGLINKLTDDNYDKTVLIANVENLFNSTKQDRQKELTILTKSLKPKGWFSSWFTR